MGQQGLGPGIQVRIEVVTKARQGPVLLQTGGDGGPGSVGLGLGREVSNGP